MAKNNFSSKHQLQRFFIIFGALFSLATLGIIVLASQQKTNIQSEATGENTGSVSYCSAARGFAGGIELFDGPNQTLDQRVMCITLDKIDGDSVNNDPHLGTNQNTTSNYSNIWNFNNRTDSVKVRANPFCIVEARIYKDTNYGTLLEKYQAGAMSVNDVHIKNFNLPSAKRGIASSLEFKAWCDYSKY